MLKELVSRQETLEEYLKGAQSELAEHILSAHDGKPATTCHTCMNGNQAIQVWRIKLTKVQQEIQELSTPDK